MTIDPECARAHNGLMSLKGKCWMVLATVCGFLAIGEAGQLKNRDSLAMMFLGAGIIVTQADEILPKDERK